MNPNQNDILVKARVSLGIQWLDKLDKDWHKKINLETLDLASTKNCILGQLQREAENLPLEQQNVLFKFWTNHGFDVENIPVNDVDSHNYKADYDFLKEVWKTEIKNRLNNECLKCHEQLDNHNGLLACSNCRSMYIET